MHSHDRILSPGTPLRLIGLRCAAALAALLPAAVGLSVEIFVATDGSDAQSGSKNQPFATLQILE